MGNFLKNLKIQKPVNYAALLEKQRVEPGKFTAALLARGQQVPSDDEYKGEILGADELTDKMKNMSILNKKENNNLNKKSTTTIAL